MRKIGILGGAFNPPTTGHIKLAEFVLANTDMEEVWVTPCFRHLYGKDLVEPQDRLSMCLIATRANPDIHVFDYEIRHKMRGSTYDLARKLNEDPNLDVDFSLIIGQDNANGFSKWHRNEELRKMAKFIVVGRTGVEVNESINWYKESPHTFIPWNDMPECSSTQIRDHLEKYGYETHPLLDDRVLSYIKGSVFYPTEQAKNKTAADAVKANKMFNGFLNGLRKMVK